jgi:hypothetical protein
MNWHTKACAVVAGGWSVRPHHRDWLNATLRPGLDIIAVNDAALHVHPSRCVVTMDRKWLEHRFDMVDALGATVFYRKSTVGKKSPLFGRIDEYKHVAFHNNNSPGAMIGHTVPFTLYGNNSGACALNLAFIRRYHTVFLLGFDMQKGPHGENHFYPDYEWNRGATKPGALAGWANTFRDASDQFAQRNMRVFNVNSRSLIRDFPVISFEEFTRMLS